MVTWQRTIRSATRPSFDTCSTTRASTAGDASIFLKVISAGIVFMILRWLSDQEVAYGSREVFHARANVCTIEANPKNLRTYGYQGELGPRRCCARVRQRSTCVNRALPAHRGPALRRRAWDTVGRTRARHGACSLCWQRHETSKQQHEPSHDEPHEDTSFEGARYHAARCYDRKRRR